MHHTTSVGHVLDENDKPVPGKTFLIKGVLESNHAGELVTEDEFKALVADDVEFKRTAGGGFEYTVEIVVSEGMLAKILAAKPKPEAPAPVVSDTDRAIAYFKTKGYNAADAKSMIDRFGTARILAAANAEADEELAKVLAASK